MTIRNLNLRIARLYPRWWRSRYGVEYEEVLLAIPKSGMKDLLDVVRHLGSVWVGTLWRSPYGPALAVAVCVLCLGLANAASSIGGGVAVWRATGVFMLIGLLLVPISGVIGFLTARRAQRPLLGAAGGLSLLVVSLLLPSCILFLVSSYFAASAEPFPATKYLHLPNPPPPAVVVQVNNDLQVSRDWFEHWRRSVWFTLLFACGAGAIAGGLGGGMYALRRKLKG